MSSPKKLTSTCRYNFIMSKSATPLTPDRIKKTKSPDEEPGTDIIHTKTKAKHTSLPLEYEQLEETEESAFFPYIIKYCNKGKCDTYLFTTLQLTELMDLIEKEVPHDLTNRGCCRSCASAAVNFWLNHAPDIDDLGED